jgi:hypothetical protein
MFPLRSRLWLSYAFIIVTALGLVAMILFVSQLLNPLLIVRRSGEVAGGTDDRERALKCAAIPIHFCFAENAASRTFDVRVFIVLKR